MEKLTVIIPIIKLETEVNKAYFKKAVESALDNKVLVVGDKDALESISGVETINEYRTLLNESGDISYPAQVNLGVKNADTDYFSILEFDDSFSKFWFNEVEKHIKNDTADTFAFLPLTEEIDNETKETLGYANEAFWASSFSEEIGCLDMDSFKGYLNFNVSGGIFKRGDFLALGALKPSMKLVYWYEFLLRALYKEKRIEVIPKVGCFQISGRPDGLTKSYADTMSEKEADWWIDLAQKEYFFPTDRNKTYEE